jgi:hypothetical protein
MSKLGKRPCDLRQRYRTPLGYECNNFLLLHLQRECREAGEVARAGGAT